MIRDLDHFIHHFKKYADDFILVGGVATYLLLDDAGAARVRPTKDLDIVSNEILSIPKTNER